EGMTVLVSSHILAELQDYSSHILMLKEGRLVEHAPLETFAAIAIDRLEIRLDFALPDQDLARRLALGAGIEVLSCSLTSATIEVGADPAERAAALARVVATGLPLVSFAPERRNLQDIYLDRMKDRNAPDGNLLEAPKS